MENKAFESTVHEIKEPRVRIAEASYIECVYLFFSVIFYLLSLYWTVAISDLYFKTETAKIVKVDLIQVGTF